MQCNAAQRNANHGPLSAWFSPGEERDFASIHRGGLIVIHHDVQVRGRYGIDVVYPYKTTAQAATYHVRPLPLRRAGHLSLDIGLIRHRGGLLTDNGTLEADAREDGSGFDLGSRSVPSSTEYT